MVSNCHFLQTFLHFADLVRILQFLRRSRESEGKKQIKNNHLK